MKKLVFIYLMVILLMSCASQKHVNPNRIMLPKEKYENDIKILDKGIKAEKAEIKQHKRNLADYNKERKAIKTAIKSMK